MTRHFLSNAYRWARRRPLTIYLVITATFIAITWGYDKTPLWLGILYFVLSSVTFSWIDNQLPRRKYRSLSILFITLLAIFTYAAFRMLPAEDDSAWILAILLTVTTGYGGYCIWRWRRLTSQLTEVKLRRATLKRRRNIY